MIAIYSLMICTLCYLFNGFSCITDKDYPHSIMWVAYAMANCGMIWYEFNKLKGDT